MNNRLKSRYSQTKTIKEIPIEGKPNHYYKVNLFYNKGGANYFSGTYQQRGYYLSVKPVEKKQHDGYTTESYALFSGIGSLVESANRFSQKTLESLSLKNYDQAIQDFINRISAKSQSLAV